MKYIVLELHFIAINVQKEHLKMNLENVQGIGEKTATMLLQKFKSVKRIKETSLEELAAVIGNSKAKILSEYLNKKKGAWMKILPRFKIQYPMKNHYKGMQPVLLNKFFMLYLLNF